MHAGLAVRIVRPFNRAQAAIIPIACRIMHRMPLIATTRGIQCRLAVTLVVLL